jgi:AcrR family transcriptional regulator
MPRAGLDRVGVVRAATALADEEGLDALTLARLAARLGVRAPSLYGHVGGLDDLRAAVAQDGMSAMADALAQVAVGLAGADALRALADAYRVFAKAHPGSYAAMQRADAGGRSEGAERVVGLFLAVLRGYGLDGDDALHAARGVRAALHGFVTLETGGGFGIPLDLDVSYTRMVTMLDSGLRALD